MQTTLIFGIHPVLAALRKAPESVLEAWVLEGREDSRMSEVLSLLREAGRRGDPPGHRDQGA